MMFNRTKKMLVLILTLCMMGSLFAGCAGGGGQSVFRDTASWPPANSYVANNFNPNGVGWQIGSVSYEGTFAYVAVSGVMKPRLAVSYDQDEMSDTIHYRKDVKWNDGKPFTSKDIWAYYTLNSNNAVTLALSSLEIVDDYTVKFNWREKLNKDVRIRTIAQQVDATIPYHIFKEFVDKADELIKKGTPTDDPGQMRAYGLAFDEATVDALTANWKSFANFGPENKVPVGTGCYMLKNLTDSEAVMVKNPHYYNKDKVGFDMLKFSNVDTNTRQSMLQQGQLERMDGTPAKDVLEGILAANKDLVHYMTLDNASVGIAINQGNPHLAQVDFRKALVYVLDRDKIREVGNAFGKTAEYAELGMPESYAAEWINPDVLAKMTKYETNHQKATELLQGLGYKKDGNVWKDKDGKNLSFTMGTTNEFQFLNPANIAAQQLTDFGIAVEVKVLEPNVFTQSYRNHELDFACNWIDNSWSVYCPYGPLGPGYFLNEPFAMKAGNFPVFEEGARKDKVNMVYPDHNGEETDIDALLSVMLPMDNQDMVDAASRISYIINENVFSIAFFQNCSGYFLNGATIDGLPLPEEVAAQNRNVMIPKDPDKLNVLNEHWYIWVAQGLQFAEGTYKPKAK